MVVPNSVPETALKLRSPEKNSGPLTFIVASRWSPTKGYRTLVDAWDAASAPGKLHIFGGVPSRGEGVDVRALCQEIADPGSIQIFGEVQDLDPYIVAADYLIFPSDEPEGFGLLAVEAFRNGRPVIAARSGGLSEIIRHGETGLMFDPRDSNALADILEACNRTEAAQLGDAARRSYEEQYSPQRYASDFEQIWQLL